MPGKVSLAKAKGSGMWLAIGGLSQPPTSICPGPLGRWSMNSQFKRQMQLLEHSTSEHFFLRGIVTTHYQNGGLI
jgi:hypothetical protein